MTVGNNVCLSHTVQDTPAVFCPCPPAVPTASRRLISVVLNSVVSLSSHFWPWSSCVLLMLTGLCDRPNWISYTAICCHTLLPLFSGAYCVVGAVAQLVKCLPCKLKDLSLNPQYTQKSQEAMVAICDPSARGQKQVHPVSLLASQVGQLVSSRNSEKLCLKTIRVKRNRVTLSMLNSDFHTCMCALKCTHTLWFKKGFLFLVPQAESSSLHLNASRRILASRELG